MAAEMSPSPLMKRKQQNATETLWQKNTAAAWSSSKCHSEEKQEWEISHI